MWKTRIDQLKSLLASKILVLDGATGTMLQSRSLTATDFGGEAFEGCNEHLIFKRPDVVQWVHQTYLEAGADIVETNTFGATSLVLGEFSLSEQAFAINKRGAELAREICDLFSTPEKPRFVAGSIGPTTRSLSLTGGATFDELALNFKTQAEGLMAGGADYLLVETCQDTLNIKAALLGLTWLAEEKKRSVPVAVSITVEPSGSMLAGQNAEALLASIAHHDLLYIGLNCATGPELMADHIRTLASWSPFPVACVPNAGLPNAEGGYSEGPEKVALTLERFCREGWINFIGGCCGTTPAHIRQMIRQCCHLAPRVRPRKVFSYLSGMELLEVTEDNRPLLVGERTNVIGSRKFKELIHGGKFEEAAEVGRGQVKKGAQVIDVCLADSDREEKGDMIRFLDKLTRVVKVPLMIDSTQSEVFEEALKRIQGKAILNSINLEEGEERFARVVPLARRYGAALVVGTIDEDPIQGMAITRDRKLEVAMRSYGLLVDKYQVPPEDIYFDPLVFPCATGDQQYVGSALETIEGVKLLKATFPACKTVAGVSNVSFGLPEAGREVLNSVFLYHLTRAGLDLAIVNSEKLERYPAIPEAERHLSEALLFNRHPQAVADFTAHFRGKKAKVRKVERTGTPEERIRGAVVEGSKEGLVTDLDLLLKTMSPIDIINGPMMRGMDEVGRLFNRNELIVAEVLQSAEVMKAGVAHLQPHMDTQSAATRGTLLLATVKGDVHDIGKNLVDIILGNNGYKIIDLGIKVTPDTLIAEARRHQPDIIGLSGLLVKSAHQMATTAADLKAAGIDIPILVGGAALSAQFTHGKIAPGYGGPVAYAKDAMEGLSLANRLINPTERPRLIAELAAKTGGSEPKNAPSGSVGAAPREGPMVFQVNYHVPQIPFVERRILRDIPVAEAWRYINPQMLFVKHLGFKGNFNICLEAGDDKARKLLATVEEVKAEFGRDHFSTAGVVRFFHANGEGDSVVVSDPKDDSTSCRFTFPRQTTGQGYCLADYLLPRSGGRRDGVAMFVVTCGRDIRGLARRLKERGDLLKSHIVQVLAMEGAEALAEIVHQRIREWWGFPDPTSMTMMERFQARYRGKRYSFGYPACPDLALQKPLFSLLQPEEIGVELTDGFMMDPEASVSAMVFHHPEAAYFGVGLG